MRTKPLQIPLCCAVHVSTCWFSGKLLSWTKLEQIKSFCISWKAVFTHARHLWHKMIRKTQMHFGLGARPRCVLLSVPSVFTHKAHAEAARESRNLIQPVARSPPQHRGALLSGLITWTALTGSAFWRLATDGTTGAEHKAQGNSPGD